MSIEQLETLRKEKLAKCRTNTFIAVLVIALLIGFNYFVMPGQFSFFAVFISFVVIIITASINDKHKNKYKEIFMDSLFPIAVQSILKNVNFDGDRGISSSLIDSTHSMSTGDVYSSSNYVTGVYKDIKVEMSDVHIQVESTDSDGNTSYYTIFLGQWMIFDFNKTFKSNVQVWEKSTFGGISRRWNKVLKKIELEDIDFNKKFNVLSENDLDAFYILTPKLMERIKQVEASIKGTLMMVFLDNKLHVAVYNNKTTFNLSLRQKIDFDKFAAESLKDLDAIIKFVDILELDNDLFKVGDVKVASEVNNSVAVPQQEVVTTPPVDSNDVNNNGIPDDVNAVEYLNSINK